VGGASAILVQGTNLATVSYTTLVARGGPGGLGGNYGSGVPGAPQTNGKAGTGGEGGIAIVRTNSSSLNVMMDNTTVLAVGGGGGSGGQGGLEGGSGGDGGEAFAGAFGHYGVRISQSCFNATGGDGGPGSSGSLATGYGGTALLSDDTRLRLAGGGALALSAGVGKELWDLSGHGDASWRDLTWDVVGTATGLAVAVTIRIVSVHCALAL